MNMKSTNLAVLRGVVATEPGERELPSGNVVAQLDVATKVSNDGYSRKVTVPVAWFDPPRAQLARIVADVEVVVVGTVQRRFFRVGGATQSRTEVVAEHVIPRSRNKQVQAALAEAVADLTTCPEPTRRAAG